MSAVEIIQRRMGWYNAKYDAAQRMGLHEAERRYFQRIVALEDALAALARAGIT